MRGRWCPWHTADGSPGRRQMGSLMHGRWVSDRRPPPSLYTAGELAGLTIKWIYSMYWTLELASKLEDAPWPATKEELIDYAVRSGAPLEVIENLEEIEDEGDVYETIEDIWPDYPQKEDFLWDEEEY